MCLDGPRTRQKSLRMNWAYRSGCQQLLLGPIDPGMLVSTPEGGTAYGRPRPGDDWQLWDFTAASITR